MEQCPLPLSIAEVQKHQCAKLQLDESYEALKADHHKPADINLAVHNASDTCAQNGLLRHTRRNYTSTVVFMDHASRYAVLQPLRTQTAAEVAHVYVKRIGLEHAAPQLLSDRGSAFAAHDGGPPCVSFGVCGFGSFAKGGCARDALGVTDS